MTLWNFRSFAEKSELLRIIGRAIFYPSYYIFPKYVLSKADVERGMVDSFVYNLRDTSYGERILDAGAGNFRFKEILVNKGYIYESQDFDQGFDVEARGKHTYTCSVERIPVTNNYFNVILCTQVLEHLSRPSEVFAEFLRILKPGGYLALTTNFLFPIHGAPHDFLRFTVHGLTYLSEQAGLKVIDIRPRGGFFSLTAKTIFDFPEVFRSELLFGGSNPHGPRDLKLNNLPQVFVLAPFIFFLDILCTIFAFAISHFDFFDKKKRYTLGYQLIAQKT